MTTCTTGPHGRGHRVLPNRHEDQCVGRDTCPGCLPCPEDHCHTCRKEHATATCPGCLAMARDNLGAILELAPDLHHEATQGRQALHTHEGIPGGDALVLLSPGHYAPPTQRLQAEDHANDPRPPLAVLRHWATRWSETAHNYHSLNDVGSYLDGQLHRIADHPHTFTPMARDLARTRRQLEDVLHAGDRPDTTRVPCLTCGVRLEKVWTDTEARDHWRCPRCGDTYDRGRYDRAKHDHLASTGAERYVVLTDAVAAIGRPEQTVRAWIRKGLVTTRRHPTSGRLLAWWPDVRSLHLNTTTRKRGTTP